MKVMILDDDTRLREVIARNLRRAGHTVDTAASVEEARWVVGESDHDVLILDVMLPDGDGFSLCSDLRAAGDWSPVLMLTARDAVQDRVRGLDVGADDYLVKPFAFDELAARLRALQRRGPVPRPTSVVVGELELEPASRRARVGARTLEMTAREFALLELFARRADEVLTRAAIVEQVWDWAFDGDPRIVDVYVRILRKALGTGHGVPRLETVRGVGYVLRPPLHSRQAR